MKSFIYFNIKSHYVACKQKKYVIHQTTRAADKKYPVVTHFELIWIHFRHSPIEFITEPYNRTKGLSQHIISIIAYNKFGLQQKN